MENKYYWARLQRKWRPAIMRISKTAYHGTETGVTEIIEAEWTDIYSTDPLALTDYLDQVLGVDPKAPVKPKEKVRAKRQAIIKLARAK